jgi:hypothetical protein
MTCTFIAQRCSDLPVAVCCRVMKVSTSGFYKWCAQPVSDRDWNDALLTNIIVDIHRMSRRSYGSPRVHAELRLGLDLRCSRKRVERLIRQAGVQGIYRRKRGGCTRRDMDAQPSDDLVGRQFNPTEADRLWVMDVTEHPTDEGKVYCAVVLDAFSRRVVGWSIADYIRSELVVDAVQMAVWRRRPPPGQTVAHSDQERNTHHGRSAAGSVPLGCSDPWDQVCPNIKIALDRPIRKTCRLAPSTHRSNLRCVERCRSPTQCSATWPTDAE